jgi:HD-GYP domain-containing protein (c-di-GMP phosphodiesterase class II)
MTDPLRRESNNSCSPRELCCIYRTEAELQAALQVFVTSAATCSARVALTGEIALAAALLVDQPRTAHGTPRPWVQDGLACCTPADLSALLAMARVAGYRALWLAVDGAPAELVTAAVGLGITVLNLYDASRLPGSTLLEALRRHPFILALGEISENEHYCPPVQTADPDQDARFAACYQRLLARRSAAQATPANDQALGAAARLDQAYAQLNSQQLQLDLLLQQAPVLIWTTDQELVVTSILGGRRHSSAGVLAELTGKPVTYLFEEQPAVLDAHHAALRGEDARYQLSYDGHDTLARVEPLRDAAGGVVGVIGVAMDVTEQLASEMLQKAQVFAEMEEKYAALARAYVQLAKSNQDLATAYDATIAGWARALELRDKETEGHSQRVVALTLRLVERMQVPRESHAYIRWGALLHDIGKMGIPDNILLKADQPLTDKEWVVMKLHPTLAYELLSGIPYLGPALEIPYSHHEWWDGTGYPQGLKGNDIPLPARIFSVVDAWDALTNQRPYRPAWSPWRVAKHIRALSGQQFDPQVVDEFLKMMNFE